MMELLSKYVEFKNGKKRPTLKGTIPVYGGNGILDYTNTANMQSGVVIGRVGVYCGSVFLVREECWVSDNAIKAMCKENIDLGYLYYLLSSLHLNERRIGTSQPLLTQNILNNIEVEIPELAIQKKISSILELLDEKIKLNNEINKNLEEQAQAIFKSWFVDFEPFGGIQPSEMQFIPLQELCKVVTKGTTPTTLGKSFTSTGINFIKAESILDNHSIDSSKFAFIDEETNALLKRSVIKANDIVFTIAGTLGRFAMVDNSVLPANTNQAVAIIRPDETKVTPAYLYSFFIGNWHNEYYSKRIQQAVQANLSLTTIKSLPIAVLKNTTMNNYDKLVSPLFALMKSNEEENRRLSKLRDTLLPRLMSGELDVSNLDL
ncbi:restriction endonuclease subunit S [Lactobacillus iners]|uniref:restriction endonuclease subunit S n=3 Tax=Lactobacillus iners TaxID=147802 RepID=UPI002A085DCC|nr:restriction endonuclease subunit S [Lactobacillus iners]MCT7833631.1 restriction endonuclease subunit S [Lactobacillus iners]MCT7844372.1 restriction endonuclease subunit S [Lactobacillus iners]